MAKDKSLSKEERKAAKKAAKVESDSVSKVKSDKKDKKEKKARKEAVAAHALNEIENAGTPQKLPIVANGIGKDGEVVSDEETEDAGRASRPLGALVPFANPLADAKVGKKVFKSVKKGQLEP